MNERDEPADTTEDPDDIEAQDEFVPRRVSFFDSSNVLDAPIGNHAAWVDIEEADEAVCASVWAIFAKHSTANGFDARSHASIAATKALDRRRAEGGQMPVGSLPFARAKAQTTTMTETTTEEKPMGREKGSDGLTERQRGVLEAWNTLVLGGKPFNHEDIARRAGISGGSLESRSANVCTVLRRLRALNLVGDKPAGSEKPKARPQRVPSVAPRELTGKAKGGQAGGRARAERAKAAKPALVPSGTDPILAGLESLESLRATMADKLEKLDTAIDALRSAS
jgi:hypothetical protein